jgi:hypothetical protein
LAVHEEIVLSHLPDQDDVLTFLNRFYDAVCHIKKLFLDTFRSVDVVTTLVACDKVLLAYS